MSSLRIVVFVLAVSWLAGPKMALAGNKPIEDFYGTYTGESTKDDDNAELKRELSVKIHPGEKSGFVIEWATYTHKKSGKKKHKKYKINFDNTDRDNIYAAAMTSNLFGKKVPLDPLKGKPFVWTRIIKSTLTTFVWMINKDGGYELQTYDRTLTEKGMDVKFSRIRDGEQQKSVSAMLIKQ